MSVPCVRVHVCTRRPHVQTLMCSVCVHTRKHIICTRRRVTGRGEGWMQCAFTSTLPPPRLTGHATSCREDDVFPQREGGGSAHALGVSRGHPCECSRHLQTRERPARLFSLVCEGVPLPEPDASWRIERSSRQRTQTPAPNRHGVALRQHTSSGGLQTNPRAASGGGSLALRKKDATRLRGHRGPASSLGRDPVGTARDTLRVRDARNRPSSHRLLTSRTLQACTGSRCLYAKN